jgi:hypothetical protein
MEIDSDDDDEVVRELDLFLTDTNANVDSEHADVVSNLYLLQFPLKPAFTESLSFASAQFRPRHQRLNLKIAHDEAIYAADEDISREAKHLDMTSSIVRHKTNLGLAIFDENKVHLVPLAGTLQMRPNFSDVVVRKCSNAYDDDEDEEDQNDQKQDEYETLDSRPQEMLPIGLKKRESDRAQASRMQSYSHRLEVEEAENFVHLQVHKKGSVAERTISDALLHISSSRQVFLKEI